MVILYNCKFKKKMYEILHHFPSFPIYYQFQTVNFDLMVEYESFVSV